MQGAMQSLSIYYLLCKSLKIVTAYPVIPITTLESENFLIPWRVDWWDFGLGLLVMSCLAVSLFGCLCCQKKRRTKGFQEFQDGYSTDNDLAGPQSFHALELQVPQLPNNTNYANIEPLTIEYLNYSPSKAKPPATLAVPEDDGPFEVVSVENSCREWFRNQELYVPRENLKYFREIGNGWFGKVIEGCADLRGTQINSRNENVVVKILSEDATNKEKAWFLGEATIYFKLCHRNILSLYGSCLESDPYLLLFEYCPLGDLKSFLRTNSDAQSKELLIRKNVPLRVAVEVGAGLRHMHEHGMSHTDLAARNCLVASDLSIKIGDYGTGVEKYPQDYYILGDRALPIRWAAPESMECTETTIETREITPSANLWSYAILLWEVAKWGDTPYGELTDEQVIKTLLSSKSGFKSIGCLLLLHSCEDVSSNLVNAIKSCLVLEPEKRMPLDKVRHILLRDQIESESKNFEEKWENSKPNKLKEQIKSSSMQDLRESGSFVEAEKYPSFRLGPEEPVKNVPNLLKNRFLLRDSDSETEEESWRGRVERGAYTEKVKQKSKSVADLMILVHIEPESDMDLSLGPLIATERRKKLSLTGSDGDLPSLVLNDEFDLTLRKLREPMVDGSLRGFKKQQKSLTLTHDLLNSCSRERRCEKNGISRNGKLIGDILTKNSDSLSNRNLGELKQVQISNINSPAFSNNFGTPNSEVHDENKSDLLKWSNSALDFSFESNLKSTYVITPSPQSRGEYSGDDLDDDSANGDELFARRHFRDDEDYRRKMSTPDDERSTDSGFRDKESCEEESPLAGQTLHFTTSENLPKSTLLDVREEEQLQVLYELDNILDAECPDSPESSLGPEIETQVEVPEKKLEEKVESELDNQIEQKDVKSDDDSSTVSMKSDNSYVSFDIDEEFVTAIRNELMEKLPQAQMYITEPQEPLEDDLSLNSDMERGQHWAEDDEELSDIADRADSIDVSIRYNTYGTPLSPIMEEKENSNSDSTTSRSETFYNEDDEDTTSSSKPKGPLEDEVISVDTRTNEMLLTPDQPKDLLTFEELGKKDGEGSSKMSTAPLPSPEEEKSQSLYECSLPLPNHGVDSEEEENGEKYDEDNNSVSSGEFVWKAYATSYVDNREVEDSKNLASKPDNNNEEEEGGQDDDEEGEEGDEVEFTPSAWDASLAPHKSAIRSPERSTKPKERKKNVWFKKQRYHCVYEYPKETPPSEQPSPILSSWAPTSYADWEGMIDHIHGLNFSHLDDFETKNTSDEEFCVSSSNRPFQFCSSDEKFVSQFFPGDVGSSSSKLDEIVQDQFEELEPVNKRNLGELRHTRDKLKLNLIPTNGIANSTSRLFSGPTVNNLSLCDSFRNNDSGEVYDDVEESDECNNVTTSENVPKNKSPVEECTNNNVNSNILVDFAAEESPLSEKIQNSESQK